MATPLTAAHTPRGPVLRAVLGVDGGCHSTLTNALRGENVNRPHPKDAQTRVRGARDLAKGHIGGKGRDLDLENSLQQEAWQ